MPRGPPPRYPLDRVGDEIAHATGPTSDAAGSRLDAHGHPGGEEILVLDGVFPDEHGDDPAGTGLRYPAGSRHAPLSSGFARVL